MSGATDHLPRLLALVPWIVSHPDTPVGDVARQFGVTEEQIRKDLDLLFVCGLPGYGPGDLMEVVYDGDRVSMSNADTISKPLRLAPDEALALIAALRALLGTPGLVETGAVDRALAKLEDAAGGHVAGAELAVAADPTVAPDVVQTVRDATTAGRRLRMRYWVPARDEATERDVDPIRVFTSGGAVYLVGWCRSVDDVRTFRLDRALDVEVLDVPADVPEEARERAHDDRVFTPAADDRLVTLELSDRARWVADYYPCESVQESAGGLVVTMRARDDAWVRRLALSLAGVARVTEPADLAAAARDAARAALGAYAPDAGSD
ncbi:MAG: proteasome accessory factor [Frankiaceae bacterium]|nr:proteasome accessory factor [Frankiaceae bacterium]